MTPRLFSQEEDSPAATDRWMVSYADFITLMFIFFLALYALLPKETHDQLLGKVAHSESAASAALSEQLLTQLAPEVMAQAVHLRRTPQGVLLEVQDSALFEAGTAQLSPRAAALLQKIGRTLVRHPNAIQVEGHTDSVPISSGVFPSNWELSAARASHVVRLLESYGVGASRLSALGLGDTQPLADNTTAAGRARNRRVSLLIRP